MLIISCAEIQLNWENGGGKGSIPNHLIIETLMPISKVKQTTSPTAQVVFGWNGPWHMLCSKDTYNTITNS